MKLGHATRHRSLVRNLLFATVLGWLCVGLGAAVPAARPHIVVVVLDDVGFSDLGAYGSEIATPHLDAIAAAGVRFTNFHTAPMGQLTQVMLHSGIDHHRAMSRTLGAAPASPILSLGGLARGNGYATVFAGTWHLGKGLAGAPGAQGWDHYFALDATPADHLGVPLPALSTLESAWWADGHQAPMSAQFHPNVSPVDHLIGHVQQGLASGRPILAMLAFQAVQAPPHTSEAARAEALARYSAGWDAVRQQRLARQRAMGLLPVGQTEQATWQAEWAALNTAERNDQAQRMAQYAAMLGQVDQQVGRLRQLLAQAGQLDNTVFVVLSGNGADAAVTPAPVAGAQRAQERVLPTGARLPLHPGPRWAAVSNTPLPRGKGTVAEGGMRVPFILSAPGRLPAGTLNNQFVYVTDVLPTLLDLAGIRLSDAALDAQRLQRPSGKSMLPALQGHEAAVHPPEEVIGYEGPGGQALFKGRYKLARETGPGANAPWQLFDLANDPAQAQNLVDAQPDVAHELAQAMARYLLISGANPPSSGKASAPIMPPDSGIMLMAHWAPALVAAVLGLLALRMAGMMVFRWWRQSRQGSSGPG
jgi:arylsulfatase A-like enzyme